MSFVMDTKYFNILITVNRQIFPTCFSEPSVCNKIYFTIFLKHLVEKVLRLLRRVFLEILTKFDVNAETWA